MPFGKHAGKELWRLPLRYLEWLGGLNDLFDDLEEAVVEELQRRRLEMEATARAAAREFDLWSQVPAMDGPKQVFWIRLSATEAARLKDATRTGELVITPDLPVRSHSLFQAWREWCYIHKKPHVVREVRWEDIEASIQTQLQLREPKEEGD